MVLGGLGAGEVKSYLTREVGTTDQHSVGFSLFISHPPTLIFMYSLF
jgi:hypothetical protein